MDRLCFLEIFQLRQFCFRLLGPVLEVLFVFWSHRHNTEHQHVQAELNSLSENRICLKTAVCLGSTLHKVYMRFCVV